MQRKKQRTRVEEQKQPRVPEQFPLPGKSINESGPDKPEEITPEKKKQ